MTQIGLGLATLGRPEYINIRDKNAIDKSKIAFKNNTFSVLNEAYKLGVRYFDTAPSYGKGEAFLREWDMETNHPDVVLGSKWGYTYVANWELGFSGQHEVKEHSLKKLLEQWQVSKKMLPKLKYYQVHSATFESGILENQDVLNQLFEIKKETGLQIGISTSSANQKEILEAALKISIKNKLLFDCFQVTYNVFEQSTFSVLQHLLQSGKSVIIKEALANGRVFQNENFQHYDESYKLLKQLSEKYKVNVDAVALRFIIDSLKPTFVLSGASTIKQLNQNLKANNFVLSDSEIENLQKTPISNEIYWKERSKLAWN